MDYVKKLVKQSYKRFLFSSCLMLGVVSTMGAEELKDCLVVHMHSGATISYVLEERPIVTFSDTQMHIESAEVSDDHNVADVQMFTFEKSSSIGAVGAQEWRIIVKGELVLLEGLDSTVGVSLVDVQGRIVASAIVADDGSASLSLNKLETGVYVLSTTDGKSLKIFKK